MPTTHESYTILGLAQDASIKEITQTYHDLAKQHHPDKPTGNAEKFRRLNEAYQCLRDNAEKKPKDITPPLFRSIWDFCKLLNQFPVEQRVSIYEKHKDRLVTAIYQKEEHFYDDKGKAFSFLFTLFNSDKRLEIYNELKARLSSSPFKLSLHLLFKRSDSFIQMLLAFKCEERKTIYDELKNCVPRLLKYMYLPDIKAILKALEPSHRLEVYQKLKNQLPSFLHYMSDFTSLLEAFEPGQQQAICEELKNQLATSITNIADLQKISTYLSPVQCVEIWKKQKNKLPVFLKSSTLKNVLECLSLDQKTAIENDPVIGKIIRCKIKLINEKTLGQELIREIERLEQGNNSWNPYYMNSSVKIDVLYTAIDNLDLTDKNRLQTTLVDTKSLLYQALNMQRISSLSFFHHKIISWNNAQSLQSVQKKMETLSQ